MWHRLKHSLQMLKQQQQDAGNRLQNCRQLRVKRMTNRGRGAAVKMVQRQGHFEAKRGWRGMVVAVVVVVIMIMMMVMMMIPLTTSPRVYKDIPNSLRRLGLSFRTCWQ